MAMKKRSKLAIPAALLLAAGIYFLSGPGGEKEAGTVPQGNATELTIPTGEQASLLEIPAPTGGRQVRHRAFLSSYNTSTLIPDWVCYELTAEEAEGRLSREGREFRMDPDLKGCTQAMREDYYNSGWTKGHLMPAADAAFSDAAMTETFYFTNVCPQNEVLNAGDWQFLEKKVRSWAKRYGSIWVATGPIVGSNRYGKIGDRDVTVPDSFFKALLVRKENGSYSAIAFVMDNDEERYFLKDCAMSVDELERLTGFDFFPALDDLIENKVEGTVRLSDWGIRN